MKPLYYITAFVIAMFLFACQTSNTSFVKTGMTSYPEINKATDVQIVLEKEKCPNYTEIGTCNICQLKNSFLDFGGAIEEARKIAMKNGGNVVILKSIKDKTFDHPEEYTFTIGRLDDGTVGTK
jgi:hypothetical protein